jgi:hypothetical protein
MNVVLYSQILGEDLPSNRRGDKLLATNYVWTIVPELSGTVLDSDLDRGRTDFYNSELAVTRAAGPQPD